MPEDRTLRRSRDKIIAGVCGGLAEFFGWPADRFRIVYVVVSILSAGFPGTLVYIVLWLAMPPPEEGAGRRSPDPRDPHRS